VATARSPLASAVGVVRRTLAPLSPRRRRWLRFLASFELDPDLLHQPVAEPGPRDFVICGCPRSGTTLLAAALFQPPAAVTVMEPWDGMRLLPAELFASLRGELAEAGRLRRGKLDVDALLAEGAVRWVREGTPTPPLDVGSEVRLGVKWPAFWRYLELLEETRFLVCVREPFDTVASFKLKGGRLGEGLEYDLAFNRSVNAELLAAAPDRSDLRRALLYETIHRRLLPHVGRENVLLVRYECWFDDPSALIAEIGGFLGVPLGPGPARIRPAHRNRLLTAGEIDLVRERCRSAEAFGYDLGDAPEPAPAAA